MMNLFVSEKFRSHSGIPLDWKLECDALSEDSLRTIARLIEKRMQPFGKVYGLPRGGERIAQYIEPTCNDKRCLLIVDDVMTTGRSMLQAKARFSAFNPDYIQGVVVFSRAPALLSPDWIKPIFQMQEPFHDFTVGIDLGAPS